jgi:hypothetical protein
VRWPAATTEAPDTRHLRVGAWLTLGGLALAALPLPATTALHAQEALGADALIERLREIQGQLTPGAAQPAPEATTSDQELIERLRAVRRDLQAEAAIEAAPMLGEDEVQSLVAEGFGVEILRVEATESQGRPAYAVTVMNPPGNDNSAFAVETLLIDGETGGLLGKVPQTPQVAAPGPSGRSDLDRSGLEIRRRTYR